MVELARLRAGHAAAVLAFERTNRDYFRQWISDRGDEYFAHFDERHHALLADQDAGTAAYHVLVEADGTVVGRLNLIFGPEGTADLGYRLAQTATGQGLATRAVRELCDRARSDYGLGRLHAATSVPNLASQRVLLKAGFVLVGPAGPDAVGGRPGYRFERDLGPA